jgi:hypothetical protein
MAGRRPRHADEQGQSAVEAAILAAGVLVLCFLPIAFGIYFHASSVAVAAAQEAARAARTGQADPTAAANSYLDHVGQPLSDRHIQVTDDPDSVCVHVDGYAKMIVPGLRIPVHARSGGVKERFRSEDTAYRPQVKC